MSATPDYSTDDLNMRQPTRRACLRIARYLPDHHQPGCKQVKDREA